MTGLTSPYAETGTWLRGNIHAHSTASDGVCEPAQVIDEYASRGYDFLAISDHDVFTDPSEYRVETGVILIPAVEITANGPHMLQVGASEAVTPSKNRQEVIGAIREDGGVAIAAHPNWQTESHWPRGDLQRIDGYAGIEIYNGLIEHHPGSATALDRWDQLLSTGRRTWGYANDDLHRPREAAHGWNVVQVRERTPDVILNALEMGRFYASTGVTVRDVEVTDGEIHVETVRADRICLISDDGVVQQTVDGSVAKFRVPEHLVYRSDHTYVRVECLGRGGERAWLQPMFLEQEG